jgi:acyl-CoA thioesterase FadM
MNLYGRLSLFILKALFNKPNFNPLEPVINHFRVWPHDIDVNIHLTAARYFSFGDFGRMSWLLKNGFLPAFFKQGFQGVLNAQELTYIREFKPFSRVRLEVELKCWDEKYGYFEQRFYHHNDLYAVGHARMAILHKRKVVSFSEVFQRFGHRVKVAPETEAIKDWKETLAAKKNHFAK